MNRLTSMCYPEYFTDETVNYGNRMKPPLTKLRIGEYFGTLNNEMTGRADYLLLAGISASYQFSNWLSLQSFANFSHKFSNEKGEEKLGAAASFDNWDIGVALTGNHLF